MDGQKPIHHFPTLVYTEAVSTFVEKMISYVMLLNERLTNVLQKKTEKHFMEPSWFFDHLQPFLVEPFFDQVPNNGSALVKFINSSTRVGYHTCP